MSRKTTTVLLPFLSLFATTFSPPAMAVGPALSGSFAGAIVAACLPDERMSA